MNDNFSIKSYLKHCFDENLYPDEEEFGFFVDDMDNMMNQSNCDYIPEESILKPLSLNDKEYLPW